MNLSQHVTPVQARKKWNSLVSKYNSLHLPAVTEYVRNNWPLYATMKRYADTLKLDPLSSDMFKSRTDGVKIHRQAYSCFVCSHTSDDILDFYSFQHDQNLLHTQKTAIEILNELLGKKIVCHDHSTIVCGRCSNLINEADSLIGRLGKVRFDVSDLYGSRNQTIRVKDIRNISDTNKESNNNNLVDVIEGSNSDEEIMEDAIEIELVEGESYIDSVIMTDEVMTMMDNEDSKLVIQDQIITYSKRGRKRKTMAFGEDFNNEEASSNSEVFSDSEDPKPDIASLNVPRSAKPDRGSLCNSVKKSGLGAKGSANAYKRRKRAIDSSGSKDRYSCNHCHQKFARISDLSSHRKASHSLVDTGRLELPETVLPNGVITYYNKHKAHSLLSHHPCRACPKVRKFHFSSKFQFRPISISAYNTPSYNISKFLVPILSKLTVNEYTVEN